jgi:hypothetical protein
MGWFIRPGAIAVRGVQEREMNVRKERTGCWSSGVVHENELGVPAFVESEATAEAPCCCVLGVWDESEFRFCYFEFLVLGSATSGGGTKRGGRLTRVLPTGMTKRVSWSRNRIPSIG